MDDPNERWRLGSYEITRHLGPGRITDRWMAVHERRQTTHVVHEFHSCHANAERRRFLAAIEAATVLSHPHLLPVQELGFNNRGQPFVITPFTGSHDGLLTLEGLVAAKGGRLAPVEVERALTHLLQAVAHAHAAGRAHGPLDAAEVLVDRCGCLWIELYGVGRRLLATRAPDRTNAELASGTGPRVTSSDRETMRDEVRSLVELGYRLLTGIAADEPRIPADRLVKKLERRWDTWFEAGLDPMRGFETASEALADLPGTFAPGEPAPAAVAVKRVLGRFASAIWASGREPGAR